MSVSDRWHRPHADHKGQEPSSSRQHWLRGPHGISVTLDTWGPKNALGPIYDALQANWGDEPSRLGVRTDFDGDVPPPAQVTDYLLQCFRGDTLQQVLEGINFHFVIDGVSRACTHQIVRTRIGAAFMQHGGRDNDWRHRIFRMPETIHRIMEGGHTTKSGLKDCVEDWGPICRLTGPNESLKTVVGDHLLAARRIYAALVDAGVPYQDARRLLPIGTTTYIHAIYNYLALKGVLANRLEHVMDWEINAVAQLMLREVRMNCPAFLWKFLGSHSDRRGEAAFAGMDSWPPDGKHPLPEDQNLPVKRTHNARQMPFWVLSPRSMEGGPVEWIATNGTYPHREVRRAEESLEDTVV